MPVPQGPRRAAPPRKKSSQKQIPPAETEAATPSFEKDTSTHDVSDSISGSQTTPVSVPDHVEPEFDAAADPDASVRPAETVDENFEHIAPSFSVTAVPDPEPGSTRVPPPIPPPPPLGPHTESPDELEVDARHKQDILSPEDIGESIVPSIPAVSRITQETEVEPVVVPGLNEDETPVAPPEEDDDDETARRQRVAERVAKMGGFNPFGGQPMRSPTLEDEPSDVERKGSGGVIPVESEGTTLQSQPAATADLPIPVFLQGGSATVDEEGDDDGDNGNDGKY